MIAIIDNAEYAENTVAVTEALSHKHTMNIELPDLEASSIVVNASFLTTYGLIAADPILVFSTEFPKGREDVVLGSTDNGDGTFTLTFTAVDYVATPTFIYANPALAGYPVLAVQSETVAERIISAAETLVFTSAIATQFVGVSARAGLLAVGDSITISDGITPTPVVLTIVVESGVAPTITYTCDYVAAIIATVDAIVLPRTTPVAPVGKTKDNTDYSVKHIVSFATTSNDGTADWNFIARRIVSPRGFVITEPLVMDYTEAVVAP